jgi:hypothetical protein
VTNVFNSLSRYSTSQEENYLTEAFVYLLRLLFERVPEQGIQLLNEICELSQEGMFTNAGEVSISTQGNVGEGWVDIEIWGNNQVIYIEVKHDSPLGIGQLEYYWEHLQTLNAKTKMLLLLTRSRLSRLETTLEQEKYHHICWYEIYNSIACASIQDEVCNHMKADFMEFLEEKKMSLKKVGWEYINGVTNLVHLVDMIEAALSEAVPDIKYQKTGGWFWRGYYIQDNLFVGVRYDLPLIVVLEDDRGYKPTYKVDLDLEKEHFFSLTKDEQFELLIKFIREGYQEYMRRNQ